MFLHAFQSSDTERMKGGTKNEEEGEGRNFQCNTRARSVFTFELSAELQVNHIIYIKDSFIKIDQARYLHK